MSTAPAEPDEVLGMGLLLSFTSWIVISAFLLTAHGYSVGETLLLGIPLALIAGFTYIPGLLLTMVGTVWLVVWVIAKYYFWVVNTF